MVAEPVQDPQPNEQPAMQPLAAEGETLQGISFGSWNEFDEAVTKAIQEQGNKAKVTLDTKIVTHASTIIKGQVDGKVKEIIQTMKLEEIMDKEIESKVKTRVIALEEKMKTEAEMKNEINVARLEGRMDQWEKTKAAKGSNNRNEFNEKRADKLSVPEWNGKHDAKLSFNEFSDLVKNWAEALYPGAIGIMERYEDHDQDPEEIKDHILDESLSEFSSRLYEKLFSIVKAEATAFIKK